MWRHLVVVAVIMVLGVSAASAQTTQELKRMSLEQLLDIEVSTASRSPEPTRNVAAAIHVITQDDIRRSGATSIPEALRLAPGVEVTRVSGDTWSIGLRGFADRLARSVLVLIDGRAVYSPLFAGTYWEVQDTLLADVDRIEVILGPGGTLWGANAVNGIINIITKPAAETQGLLVSGGAGSEQRGEAAIRYGGGGGSARYRVYAKADDRGAEAHGDGDGYDTQRSVQAGFRSDWALANGAAATLQGDLYQMRYGERATVASYTPPYSVVSDEQAPLAGGNVLARLSRTSGVHDVQVQMYYDRTSRAEVPVGESRDTFDVDFQDVFRRWPRHTIAWGAGYRVSADRLTTSATSVFMPNDRTDNLTSAFLQDEIAIVPDRWRLTLGSKIEHNSYSGVEVQPSARVLWTPARAGTIWGAVTRAVRTPSRVETDYSTTSFLTDQPAPTFVRLEPNPAFVAEKLVAYEIGYRAQPLPVLSISVSTFDNQYRDLLSTELLSPFAEETRTIIPVTFGNGVRGHSGGGEVTADLRLAPWWRVTGSYSHLVVVAEKTLDSHDVSQVATYEGTSPRHQAQVGSSLDIGRVWSIDWSLRYVSAFPNGSVPAYTASTIRLGWRGAPGLDIALVGQDLFAGQHVEWPTSGGSIGIARSVMLRATWTR